jgi:antitoxin component YwqK of YwqJK toxin-antitoxin module
MRISRFIFFLLFITANAFAQKQDSVNYYQNKKVHEIFSSVDSMKMNYKEFDSTGILKREGELLHYYVIRDVQVEDPVTHLFVLVLDTHRNVKMGLWTEYYPNGKRKLECIYDSSGILNGMFTAWYENGQIDSTGKAIGYFYKHETWDFYYENGVKKRKEDYDDLALFTQPESIWFKRVDYYSSGTIKQIEQFDFNGDLTGDFFSFQDGNKWQQYGSYFETVVPDTFNNQVRFISYTTIKKGIWITFDKNENIQSIENFDANGNKIAITKEDQKIAEEKRLELLKNKEQIISKNSHK